MAKPLTDSVVSTAKPQRGQTGWRDISDGGCRGLVLRVSPRGEKAWMARHTVGGQRKAHTLGAYPAISLAEARRRATDYLASAREGISAEEVDARARAEKLTVTAAHAEYISAATTLKARTRTGKEALFKDHIQPVIGGRLIRTVRSIDVREVVGAVIAKGFTVQANRVFSELMALLRWCEQKHYLDGVPAVRKKELQRVGAAKEKPRRRTLSPAEIAEAWQELDGLGRQTRDFVRLLVLTGQRRDEVRLMSWEEVDLAQAFWTIPAARYKTGLDHAVPLSTTAMAILRSRHTKGATGFIFAGRKKDMPFNGSASALRRLREAMPTRAAFTLHDLRRTFRSGLSRLGVDEETAELAIGHVPQGMAKTYNLYDRLDERTQAFERWCRYVKSLVEERDNVVPIAAAREPVS